MEEKVYGMAQIITGILPIINAGYSRIVPTERNFPFLFSTDELFRWNIRKKQIRSYLKDE